MTVHIVGGKISNCGTGVKTVGDVELRVENLEIKKTKKAYDISDRPGTLRQAGGSRRREEIVTGIFVALISSGLIAGLGAIWTFLV